MALPYQDLFNIAPQKSQSTQDWMGKELENSFNRIKNQYEPERLGLANEFQKITNRFEPERLTSNIGLTNAKSKYKNLESQYHPPLWQNADVLGKLSNKMKGFEVQGAEREAQIMQQLWEAAQQQMKNPSNALMNGGQSQQGQPNYISQGQQPYNEPGSINQQALKPMPGQPGYQNKTIIQPGNPSLKQWDDMFLSNPAIRRTLEKMFPGTGVKTEDNETTGESTSSYTLPSGEISKVVTPIKKPEGFKKANVSAYEKANEEIERAHDVNNNIEELSRLVTESTGTIEPLVGKLGGRVPDWLLPVADMLDGKKYTDMRGRVKGLLGNIVVETAKDVKGPYKGAEAQLIDSFKPLMTDSFDVFLGKLKSLSTIQQMALKRKELYADYLNQQYDSNDAARMAREQTPMSSIQKEVNNNFSRQTLLQKRGENGMQFRKVPSHLEKDLKTMKDEGWSEVK